MDSYRRTDYLNKPVVDGAFVGEPRVHGPKVDEPKKSCGTQLVIMWSPRNPK